MVASGRKLDWDYTYVREDEVFPQVISGHPWLPHAEWKEWENPLNFLSRIRRQPIRKDMAVYACARSGPPGKYSEVGCTMDQ